MNKVEVYTGNSFKLKIVDNRFIKEIKQEPTKGFTYKVTIEILKGDK